MKLLLELDPSDWGWLQGIYNEHLRMKSPYEPDTDFPISAFKGETERFAELRIDDASTVAEQA